MSVNKVILVGRLGAEPETRAFPDGGSICNLRVATSESWKDKTSGERKERTEWHRCVLRNKLGEIAQQYLHKGSQVYLEGRIQTRKWQDQDGNDKYATDVVCSQITMLDSKSQTDQPQQRETQAQQPAPAQALGNTSDYLDDDIPF